MIEGLRRAGIEVIECHEPLWRDIEDRVGVAGGGWRTLAFWRRALGVYWRLWQRHRQVGEYDILIVGYPGALDVFLARLLAGLRGKPLVWDVFMSIYLIALERGLQTRSELGVRLLFALEWLALRVPQRLTQDTVDYVDWLSRTYGVSPDRFRLVPTGADERLFKPQPSPMGVATRFRVLYYGSFIPNHGIMTIMEAARLLTAESAMTFELIGDGPERANAEVFAREHDLTNIMFVDWLAQQDLISHIAAADVCLGAFGATPQSLMTVQNKIYEGMAMGKPVITGDSPAVRRGMEHREHVYLVPRGDGAALTQAILDLRDDGALRKRLGSQAAALFVQRYSLAALGATFASHLHEVQRSGR